MCEGGSSWLGWVMKIVLRGVRKEEQATFSPTVDVGEEKRTR